jgi:hypothetical protein
VLNKEAIRINQDPGHQGRKVADYGDSEVWYKRLQDRSAAFLLLNRNINAKSTIEFDLKTLGIIDTMDVTEVYTGEKLPGVSGLLSLDVNPGTGIFLLLQPPPEPFDKVKITETDFKNTPHFKVETLNATYYIEKQSGGCSSLIDSQGNDWISFSKKAEKNLLNSSDSDFRGLPNLVHKNEDSGVGHPGFNVCQTRKISQNQLHVLSQSGKWEYTWTFYNDFSVVDIIKSDTTRNYWFLYEGPVAGKFNPASHYWGNNIDGIRPDKPNYKSNPVLGNWKWGFVGDTSLNRVLYICMEHIDSYPDFFGFMGNNPDMGTDSHDGMAVLGFGRGLKPSPLLKGNQKFYIGFYEQSVRSQKQLNLLSRHIRNRVKK